MTAAWPEIVVAACAVVMAMLAIGGRLSAHLNQQDRYLWRLGERISRIEGVLSLNGKRSPLDQ